MENVFTKFYFWFNIEKFMWIVFTKRQLPVGYRSFESSGWNNSANWEHKSFNFELELLNCGVLLFLMSVNPQYSSETKHKRQNPPSILSFRHFQLKQQIDFYCKRFGAVEVGTMVSNLSSFPFSDWYFVFCAALHC